MNEQEIKELVERLRGIYPVGEYGIRKFETPIIQQEAVAAIEHLQAENKKLRKTIDGIISSEQERIDGMADDYAVLQAELRAKDERIKKLEEYNNDLYIGMSRIAYPIWWAQEDAKLSGCEVDGQYAVMLSNDAQHLKLIARSFIKQAPKVRVQE